MTTIYRTVFISRRSFSRASAAYQQAAPREKPIQVPQTKAYTMKPVEQLYVENGPVYYKERTIKVHACRDIYPDWKANRPGFENVNKNGLIVDIPFIHTGLDRGQANRPNVVAVHGAPGSHRDFDAIIPVLDLMGANVIAPTFPDLHYTVKTQNYWHTLEEKTDLLKCYLEKLNVPQVDMLVCHSSAMYSALQLALNSSIKVKSLVFVAPAGCRQLTQMSPMPLFQWYTRQFRKPHMQKPLLAFAIAIIKAYGKPSTDTVGTVCSMITMISNNYDGAGPLCKEVKNRAIPTLMFYGKRDKLIDISISEEMADYFGNPQKESYYVYKGKDDTEVKLVQPGVSNYTNAEIVCLEQGSHFAFKKFPDTFNYHIANFFQRHIRENLSK